MRWLLLRGLTREQRHWGRFPETFEARLETTSHRLDLPGVGTEAGRRSPYRISEIVDDVRSRFHRTDQDQAWGLLAISLGGMVAADWCHRYPEDFSRVVIINSSAGGLSPARHRMRFRNLPKLIRSIASRDLAKRELGVLSLTTSSHGSNHVLAAEWAGYLEQRRPLPQVALGQLVAAMRFQAPPPGSLSTPSMILTAEGDRFTAPDCSRRLASHFGSTLHVHPSAGHDLPLDDPEWVSARVKEWLAA